MRAKTHKNGARTPYERWQQVRILPSTFERERLEREIAATDSQIDRLVYDLYELTEEEIRIVEG